MIAEILSVGTELLMGQIANTDAQFISRRLGELGISIYRQCTVGDNPARVLESLRESLSRSDIVITTGGWGPRRTISPRKWWPNISGWKWSCTSPHTRR